MKDQIIADEISSLQNKDFFKRRLKKMNILPW